MNKTEKMILYALANGGKIEDYKHLNKELHNLHSRGLMHCYFDEQNHVISGSITSEGKPIINKISLYD